MLHPRVLEAHIEIDKARAALNAAQNNLAKTEGEVIVTLENSGWVRVDHISSYYGHHEERGEGDIHDIFFFPPGTHVPTFPEFSHGSYSDPDAFEVWLEEITKEGVLFYEFESNCE